MKTKTKVLRSVQSQKLSLLTKAEDDLLRLGSGTNVFKFCLMFSHICQHLPSILDSLLEDGVSEMKHALTLSSLSLISVRWSVAELISLKQRCCIQALITETSFFSDLPHELLWHDYTTCRIHVQTCINEISQTRALCGHVVIMSVSVVTVLQTLLRMSGWLILTLDTTVDILQTVLLSFNHHHLRSQPPCFV